MFSFAAAQMVDCGAVERLAMLRSRDTRARLQWTLHCIEPYRQQLQAQHAIRRAIG